MKIQQRNALRLGAVLLFGLSAGMAQSAEILLRFNDYDGNAYANPDYTFSSSAGPATVTSVEGYAGIGVDTNVFSGNMLRNAGTGDPQGAITATWGNLPVGGTISFSFLFAAIDSWDASDLTFGPDRFEILLDGNVIWSTIIGNFPPSSSNGGTLISSGNFGFTSTFIDSAWDFTSIPELQNIAYTGTSAAFAFRAAGAGWQGGNDESWAWDNVRVTLNVPEPTTLALLGLSLAGLAASRRRKK